MWDGLFKPFYIKHRDYEHGSFAEHEFANGARYEILGTHMVHTDPITERRYFYPRRKYYLTRFRFHDGKYYDYLIPPEPDGSEPNLKRIKDTLDEYASNPIEGGRDWRDYVDEDEE